MSQKKLISLNEVSKTETIERTKALFQYIRELISLKYNIVTDVEKQAWHYYLKDNT